MNRRFVAQAVIFVFGFSSAHAVLIEDESLTDLCTRCPWILHVKIVKTEVPFEGEGNRMVRLGLAELKEVLKSSTKHRLVDIGSSHPEVDLKKLILEFGARSEYGPIEPGNEYIVFCETTGLIPFVRPTGVFRVKNRQVRVLRADFPSQKDDADESESHRWIDLVKFRKRIESLTKKAQVETRKKSGG